MIITLVTYLTFSFSSRIDKLIDKSIKNTFKIEAYEANSVVVNAALANELPIKISGSNFKKISAKSNDLLGYYYLGKAFGKVDYFDYLVIFNNQLEIIKVKILIYREDRGGEIASKRWLKQFIGKSIEQSVKLDDNIAGISGATISANSITVQIDQLLKSLNLLRKHSVL